MCREIDKSQSSATIKLTRTNVSQSSQVSHRVGKVAMWRLEMVQKQREDERETRTRLCRIIRGAAEHGDVRRFRNMVAKDRLTESDNVMWRNFEPQTQNRSERKTVFKLLHNRTKATNGETWNQSAYIFQLIRQVNGQQILERIVLAAKPVRLRKEGLGIRVIPKADPMSKKLSHHFAEAICQV